MNASKWFILCFLIIGCTKDFPALEKQVVSNEQPKKTEKRVYSGTTFRPKIAIQLLLNLDGGSSNTADGVVLFYDTAFKLSVGNEDSYKFTNPDENLAINEKGSLLSIEGKPMPYNDSTFLNIWQFRQTTYYLQIKGANFPSGYTARIWDRYLHKGQHINLYATNTIKFTANENFKFRYKLYINKL